MDDGADPTLLKSQFYIFQQKPKNFVCSNKMI